MVIIKKVYYDTRPTKYQVWSLFNLLKPTGYVMHHQCNIRSAHNVFMCFVFIWEQTANCTTYSLNWLVFITDMKSVYSAVRTGSLNKTVCPSSLKGYMRAITHVRKKFALTAVSQIIIRSVITWHKHWHWDFRFLGCYAAWVVSYWSFGKIYRYHLQGSGNSWTDRALKMGMIGCPETSATDYTNLRCVTSQKSEATQTLGPFEAYKMKAIWICSFAL